MLILIEMKGVGGECWWKRMIKKAEHGALYKYYNAQVISKA